jgi:pSer/pThr/pTyr-binding forkhead associated (FHA) protein
MDGALLVIWIVRLLFLALLYVVLFRIVRTLLRDLRQATREPGTSLGRLVVVTSPAGEPAGGRSFDLDAITTLGRDVNNAIVIDDPFASSEHAILTYRGRSWYVEDAGSTNGTARNGRSIQGPSPLGFGDEIGIGQVRLRLERPRGG